ncbi:MAG: small multi-drug export protein [Planctomycetota bacterium]
MLRAQRYAEARQATIMKWGVPGLLLFVWFPFWMTGPVVGSVIGFLIGMRPWVTMAVVLAGTSLAIVCWVYVLDQMFVQLRALGPYVPFVFVGLILLIAVSIHVRQAIARRANGPQAPEERDQD